MTTITLQRDTDQVLTEHLDDNDLLNLCRAVPNLAVYQDDNFWKNRLLTKYGPIDKMSNKTWKTVYLQMVHYMHKGEDWDERIKLAARGGHQDLIEYFIIKGGRWWNLGLSDTQGGHRDMLDYFITKGVCDSNYGMYHAAKEGDPDLVDYFITRGAENWNWGMTGAAKGGHRDLVDQFVNLGAHDWDREMFFAAARCN